MKTDLIFDSAFAHWCQANRPYDTDTELALRKEALEVLVKSFERGEITSIDGVKSAGSRRIIEKHGDRPFEMNSNWICSAQDWVCPCCGRSKIDVSRVGAKEQILAKLVIHHDHMGEVMEEEFRASFVGEGIETPQIEGQRLVECMGNAFAAYEEVLICEDCNNADANAKKLVGAPRYFSFSIGQMRQFIRATPNESHVIDEEEAKRVWSQAKPAYELRMRLIREVAHAAATDSHWYEPYKRTAIAVPMIGYDRRVGVGRLTEWMSIDDLCEALGRQAKLHDANLAKWRTTKAKIGKPLPPNFLALLQSSEHLAKKWDGVSDEWRCPVCARSKYELVYVGEQGKIRFHLVPTSGRGGWAQTKTICNHCQSTIMSLKLELSKHLGHTPRDSYGFVSPGELAGILVARPHSSHLIKTGAAAELFELALNRLAE